MVEPWFWAVCLLAVGLAIAVMEIFFPSGGLLGFLSAISLVAAVFMAFRQGPWVGLGILAACLAGVPAVVALGLKWWPKTAMGRRMLLIVPQQEDVLPDTSRQRRLKDLPGRVGVAKSKMLPSGAVLVDGRSIDAVSEGMPIEAGQRVRILEVRGNRVVVRPVTAEDEPTPQAASPLDRPIDAISPDPFRDTPA